MIDDEGERGRWSEIYRLAWIVDVCKKCNFFLLYTPQQSCRGVYWFHHVRPSVDKSYVVR
jgi:hypothetical protein